MTDFHRFESREPALEQLKTFFNSNQESLCIVIRGMYGTGKSRLIQHSKQQHLNSPRYQYGIKPLVLEHLIYKPLTQERFIDFLKEALPPNKREKRKLPQSESRTGSKDQGFEGLASQLLNDILQDKNFTLADVIVHYPVSKPDPQQPTEQIIELIQTIKRIFINNGKKIKGQRLIFETNLNGSSVLIQAVEVANEYGQQEITITPLAKDEMLELIRKMLSKNLPDLSEDELNKLARVIHKFCGGHLRLFKCIENNLTKVFIESLKSKCDRCNNEDCQRECSTRTMIIQQVKDLASEAKKNLENYLDDRKYDNESNPLHKQLLDVDQFIVNEKPIIPLQDFIEIDGDYVRLKNLTTPPEEEKMTLETSIVGYAQGQAIKIFEKLAQKKGVEALIEFFPPEPVYIKCLKVAENEVAGFLKRENAKIPRLNIQKVEGSFAPNLDRTKAENFTREATQAFIHFLREGDCIEGEGDKDTFAQRVVDIANTKFAREMSLKFIEKTAEGEKVSVSDVFDRLSTQIEELKFMLAEHGGKVSMIDTFLNTTGSNYQELSKQQITIQYPNINMDFSSDIQSMTLSDMKSRYDRAWGIWWDNRDSYDYNQTEIDKLVAKGDGSVPLSSVDKGELAEHRKKLKSIAERREEAKVDINNIANEMTKHFLES